MLGFLPFRLQHAQLRAHVLRRGGQADAARRAAGFEQLHHRCELVAALAQLLEGDRVALRGLLRGLGEALRKHADLADGSDVEGVEGRFARVVHHEAGVDQDDEGEERRQEWKASPAQALLQARAPAKARPAAARFDCGHLR